jgi:glycine C-acetyltransferase
MSRRLDDALARQVASIDERGTAKRHEPVVVALVPADGERGPRVRLTDGREYLRMSSNGYLGLATHPAVVAAEEAAVGRYGCGPGAVRFISGTTDAHLALEARLAAFHGRPAACLSSAAYGAVLGSLVALTAPGTAVISDELNHNCIITGTRMAQPARKAVYGHLDLTALERELRALDPAGGDSPDGIARVLVVTDGVFSMRGDHAPLAEIAATVARHDARFADGVTLVVDDSHGVGALGPTGRGTEEVTGGRADVLVATLGKALGVNGGYVVGSETLVDVLRETAPTYVYSNPITAAEAAAALAAVDVLDSPEGLSLLTALRHRTAQLRDGLVALGYETLPGQHPVVPLVLHDAGRTRAVVEHLRAHGVLATGLAYPVVPRGEDEIRFQVCATHTEADIAGVLDVLARAPRE